MLEAVRAELAAAIAAALGEIGVAGAEVALEVPPRRDLGDLAWAGALPLAKALRRPPRAIAEDVLAAVQKSIAGAAKDSALALLEPAASVEGPGFLNFRLKRGPVLAALLVASTRTSRSGGLDQDGHGHRGPGSGIRPPAHPEKKVVVEHTNINPNKAAHIGHLRNAVLGDTLVRCLRWLGETVEVQNYVDDTGVQVADVVVGLLHLPEAELAATVAPFWPETAEGGEATRRRVLEALAGRHASATLLSFSLGEPDFDDLCWELYPKVTARYAAEPPFAEHRVAVLHAIEAGFPADLSLTAAARSLSGGVGASSLSPSSLSPTGPGA